MDDKVKKKLHNTRKLLQNYRYLKYHLSLPVAEEEENIQYLKDVKESRDRTTKFIAFIDGVMEKYQEQAYKDGIESTRRYTVIDMMYISDHQTFEEIATLNNCAVKTVTRDRDRAIEELAILLFGIDGLGLRK